MTIEQTYWLTSNTLGSTWTKVTREEWIRAERQAGFRPKLSSADPAYMTTCATGGFSSSVGISGSITSDGQPPKY